MGSAGRRSRPSPGLGGQRKVRTAGRLEGSPARETGRLGDPNGASAEGRETPGWGAVASGGGVTGWEGEGEEEEEAPQTPNITGRLLGPAGLDLGADGQVSTHLWVWKMSLGLWGHGRVEGGQQEGTSGGT